MRKTISTYDDGKFSFKYITKLSSKKNMKYRILKDQIVCIYYSSEFLSNIKSYLIKNAKLINNSLMINNTIKLLDFSSDTLKILGCKYKLVWHFNQKSIKQLYEKYDDNMVLHIFSKSDDSYKNRRKKILNILHDLGNKDLYELVKNMIKKEKINNVQITITENTEKWVEINKNDKILYISIISFVLPSIVLEFILRCKLKSLYSHETDYQIYQQIQKEYENFDEIKKYLVLRF